jgi:hypothetical protein
MIQNMTDMVRRDAKTGRAASRTMAEMQAQSAVMRRMESPMARRAWNRSDIRWRWAKTSAARV